MRWRWVTSTLAFRHPQLPRIRYTAIITCPEPGMLPLFFPVRKFLQLPVQDPMGSLARPVTGYDAHDDAGHDQQC